MKVLLIEDDAMIGENIEIALESDAIAVDWVRSGAEADALLARRSYDALLLDLGLPHRDGIEVLRDLRARQSVRRCRR
jgi:DNA-binding response OmpR family regulator